MSFPNGSDTSMRPKCSRCRNHGLVVPKKGHTKICPYLTCQCPKCGLVTERSKITALQRELRKAKKEQRPGAGSVDREATCAPGKGPPTDPPGRPEPGEQPVSSSDMRNVLPSASGQRPPLDSPGSPGPGFSDVRQMAPLPFIPFPFKMPCYYPRGYSVPSPHLMPNVPWLPSMPVGFGPLMFPHPQQGALTYPRPPALGPPPNSRHVLFIRQPQRDSESSEEEQHPPPPLPGTTEQDAAEQVSEGE